MAEEIKEKKEIKFETSKRGLIVLLDSVGIGEAPDAADYGDQASDTLGNMAKTVGGLDLPNLAKLGLGNIRPILGVEALKEPLGNFGKMQEISCGKDTTSGHWEIAGTPILKALPTYPKGFPQKLIAAFEVAIGKKTLGNEVASGTEIIARLGKEHCQTGYPIVYTSADSVFQIACHEEIIPLEELYKICRAAREILVGENGVGRVIARPFSGEDGDYVRTANRRDFSLQPPANHLLEQVQKAGLSTVSVGKIHDIFAESGVEFSYPTTDNADGVAKLLQAMAKHKSGLIWANLVDFDAVYGHRNNPQGYAKALTAFDEKLPQILAALKPDDLLIITADHGNDPTTPSTDHSREFVPLLVYGPKLKKGVDLGIRPTFADLGATVADYLQTPPVPTGNSFLEMITF